MTDPTPLDDAFKKICAMEVPLGERLARFTAAVAEHGRPFALAYDNLVAQIGKAAAGATAPALGEPMPPFLLPDHTASLTSLDELLSNGPVVVSFNRGHWCEYCQLELRAFAAAHEEFAAAGAKVVSIMPERGEYTRTVRAMTNGALNVGIVMWLGDEVCSLYKKFGLAIDRYQGNATWFVPIPATFVLNRNGTIVGRKVDPDFRHRMDIEEILQALGAK
jgi:peroxiredoxin